MVLWRTGGAQVVQGVWAPRSLLVQEPLWVSCPRVCIELMYKSSVGTVLGLTLNKLENRSINHSRQGPDDSVPEARQVPSLHGQVAYCRASHTHSGALEGKEAVQNRRASSK